MQIQLSKTVDHVTIFSTCFLRGTLSSSLKCISLSRLQGLNCQEWGQILVVTTRWHCFGTQRTCCVPKCMTWNVWTVYQYEKRVLLSLVNMCCSSFCTVNAAVHTHIPSTVKIKLLPLHKALLALEFGLTIHDLGDHIQYFGLITQFSKPFQYNSLIDWLIKLVKDKISL